MSGPLSHRTFQTESNGEPERMRDGEERKGWKKRSPRRHQPDYRVDARLQMAPARRSRPANRPSGGATKTVIARPASMATMEPCWTCCVDTAEAIEPAI